MTTTYFLPHHIIPPTAFGLKPTLSIDLDNVIRDQIGEIILATRRTYDVHLCREDFSQWDPPLGERLGISNEEFTAWAWSDPMIFANACPMEGVVEALTELHLRYRILITTSTAWPILTEPWLKRWRVPYDLVVHTADKSIINFQYHIDDSPMTLAKLAEAGRNVIRFALPWNNHLNLPGFTKWHTIGELL